MPTPSIVKEIHAREIFDSRGVPTIEVDVVASGGRGRSSAPFGAPGSRGEFEAAAYGPDGVAGAIRAVDEEIGPRLVGMDAADTARCDEALRAIDGTANFGRLGGNTASVLSIALARAAADSLGLSLHSFLARDGRQAALPLPLGNVIGGGAHATGPTPDMQEHLVLPVSARSAREAVELNIRVHEEAGWLLAHGDSTFVGGCDDERAWAADLDDAGALEVLAEACRRVGQRTAARFRLGLDLAADRLWDPDRKVYRYAREGVERTTAEQIAQLEKLARTFDLGYVEDAFHSNDYESFAELRRRIGASCLVCGDDLLATNQARTEVAVAVGSVNAMIVKINQIGTLTEARAANDYAQSQGIATTISHRSGETDDSAIAHVGTAWECTLIKTGVTGGERLAKLNELMRLEEALGSGARMAELPAQLGGPQ